MYRGIRVLYLFNRLRRILYYSNVHPIFGVIQAGVYRGSWRLDVRIMDVQSYL